MYQPEYLMSYPYSSQLSSKMKQMKIFPLDKVGHRGPPSRPDGCFHKLERNPRGLAGVAVLTTTGTTGLLLFQCLFSG